LAHVAGMIIYLGYGVWHSSERCYDDTQVMIMDDVTGKDSVNKWWREPPVGKVFTTSWQMIEALTSWRKKQRKRSVWHIKNRLFNPRPTQRRGGWGDDDIVSP